MDQNKIYATIEFIDVGSLTYTSSYNRDDETNLDLSDQSFLGNNYFRFSTPNYDSDNNEIWKDSNGKPIGYLCNGEYNFLRDDGELSKGYISKSISNFESVSSNGYTFVNFPKINFKSNNKIENFMIYFGKDYPSNFKLEYFNSNGELYQTETIKNNIDGFYFKLFKEGEEIYEVNFICLAMQRKKVCLEVRSIVIGFVEVYKFKNIHSLNYTQGIENSISLDGCIITNSGNITVLDTYLDEDDTIIDFLNNNNLIKKNPVKIYEESSDSYYYFYIKSISKDFENNLWSFELSDRTDFLKEIEYGGYVVGTDPKSAKELLSSILGEKINNFDSVEDVYLVNCYLKTDTMYNIITMICEVLRIKLYIGINNEYYAYKM